ncbi:serine protease inhibitor [Streptomyces sp. NPDC058401]|uniref:serine protease inhibitor n=1 Tax=Streptomyces sp. NPDC058401 TaxID=3346480 RepID=UPI0036679588
MDFVFVVAGGIFGGSSRREARRDARIFSEGGSLVFQGCIVGDRSYCASAVVHLTAGPAGLSTSPTEFVDLHRRTVPVERLQIVRARRREKGDPPAVWSSWHVLECRDGESPVLIACAPRHLGYLRTVLERGATHQQDDLNPARPGAEATTTLEGTMDKKNEWPELTGKSPEDAGSQIRAEFPEITVHVVPEGSMVTMDFNEHRVRLFVKDNKVARPPKRG